MSVRSKPNREARLPSSRGMVPNRRAFGQKTGDNEVISSRGRIAGRAGGRVR